jgi:hypothetical protein
MAMTPTDPIHLSEQASEQLDLLVKYHNRISGDNPYTRSAIVCVAIAELFAKASLNPGFHRG